MPDQNMSEMELPPASDAFRIIQLLLGDIGRSFSDVRLTPEGVFNARCPVDNRHNFLIRLEDNGLFCCVCPTCERSSHASARFGAALSARLGYDVLSSPQPRTAPISGWQRQPDRAPVLALRRLANGDLEWLTNPEQADEAREWIERSLEARRCQQA